jgi:hypothetical protein
LCLIDPVKVLVERVWAPDLGRLGWPTCEHCASLFLGGQEFGE